VKKECLLQAEEEEARVRTLEAKLERQAQELAAARSALEVAEKRQRMRDRGALDCAHALQHTLAIGGQALLEHAEERAAETAEHVGILGEREDPADALWADILSRQATCLSELLFESRALHAQSDIRARLAQINADSQAERSYLHELRSRMAIQKMLTGKLLDWTSNSPTSIDSATDSFNRAKAAGLEWRRCDVEEALGHFRTASPHAELFELLASRLGRAVEVRNIPAILGELLEHDVAAAAEVLLLECARLELTAALRRESGSLSSAGDSRGADLRRAGMVCCGLAEEIEALRLGSQ